MRLRVVTHTHTSTLTLTLLSLAFGCSVEGNDPVLDAGIAADAATKDASPTAEADSGPGSCLFGEIVCEDTEYCSPEDRCIARPTTCTTTSDCASPDLCWSGRCRRSPEQCDEKHPCGSSVRCMAAGYCAPALVDDGTLRTSCATNLDCGPAGVCAGDLACTGCDATRRCPAGLACSEGVCIEKLPCVGVKECYAGNTCIANQCTRSTVGCTSDRGNDLESGATELRDRYHPDLSICGDGDVDWYSVVVPALHGLRVVSSSTRSLATIQVEIFDAEGGDLDGTAYGAIDLPGISILDVPSGDADRTFLLRVSGNDASGSYALDIRTPLAHCAEDALDLYGDTSFGNAPVVPGDISYGARSCNGDIDLVRVDVEPDDVLSVTAAFGGNGADLDLEVLDAAGNTIASDTSTSSEIARVATDRAAAPQRLAIRVTAKRVPTAGEPYTLSILRRRGTRYRACNTAPVLSVSASSLPAETFAGAIDVGRPACTLYSPSAFPDRVFKVDLPAGRNVISARATQISGARTTTMSVALLSACEDDEAVLGCDASPRPGRVAEIERVVSGIGPVFIMVSAEDPSEDLPEDLGFALDVQIVPALQPSNDTCMQAQAIVAATATTSYTYVTSVSTHGAANDAELTFSGSCGLAGDGAGADAFYLLSLAANHRAAIELSGPPGAFLWTGTSCGTLTSTCSGGSSNFSSPPLARVTLAPRAATNYIVVADGLDAGNFGDYTLRAVVNPRCLTHAECAPLRCDDYRCAGTPLSDACDGTLITPINGHATIEGSTGAANDDFAQRSCPGAGGLDVVYAFDVPVDTTLLRARISDARFDPVIAIRRGLCANASTEVACNDDVRYPDLIFPELEIQNPPADRYFVIVDAYAGSGTFSLQIDLTRP